MGMGAMGGTPGLSNLDQLAGKIGPKGPGPNIGQISQPGGQITPGGPGGVFGGGANLLAPPPGFNPAGGGLFQPGGMSPAMPVAPGGQKPGFNPSQGQGRFNPAQGMGPIAPSMGRPGFNRMTSASQAKYNSGQRW